MINACATPRPEFRFVVSIVASNASSSSRIIFFSDFFVATVTNAGAHVDHARRYNSSRDARERIA